MVLIERPEPGEQGKSWSTVERNVLFKVQKYTPPKAILPFSVPLMGKKAPPQPPFRLVTAHAPFRAIATGDTLETVLADADLLGVFLAGCTLEDPSVVSPAIKAALEEEAKAAAEAEDPLAKAVEDVAADSSTTSFSGDWKEAAKQLEPWALKLIDNADKLRYACYALKIATSFTADVATAGMGGEEVVQLCFVGVNSAVLSSWLTWFATSYLDESPGSSVVRETLKLEFLGGPRVVLDNASEICKHLRKEDLEQVTRAAVALKNRIAMLVGDVTSLFIPDDFGIAGVMIAELLVQLKPANAVDAVRKMIGWYEVIPTEQRRKLENKDELSELMATGNTTVRNAVMKEYDKPLKKKVYNAGVRHIFTAVFPPLMLANLAGSAALGANVGKGACADTFDTIEEKLPVVAATLQKALAVVFGVLVLLANCADGADNGDRQSQVAALGARGGAAAIEVLPKVLAAAKGDGKGGGGLKAGLKAGAAEVAKKVVKGGAKSQS